MGYDMYIVDPIPGVDDAVGAAQEAFDKACKERDALGDEKGFFLSPEEEALPPDEREVVTRAKHEELNRLLSEENVPFDEARRRVQSVRPTEAYEAAQAKVEEAADAIDKANKQYFRLNIWGMSEARWAMSELGMFKAPADVDWPDAPGMDEVLVETIQEAFYDERDPLAYIQTPDFKDRLAHEVSRWNDDPTSYRTKQDLPELPEPTEEQIRTVAEFQAAINHVLSAHNADELGIDIRKVGSNDGWLVTPEECVGAVRIWDAHPQEVRDKVAADKPYVAEFIEWIRLAAQYGGFTVH